MVTYNVVDKIVLKGGPGVGKSTFMKKIGQDLLDNGIDIEFHWCSSDNHSLDGVTAGNGQVCILDGTAPHVVDPVFPGAVDKIIHLGDYWNADLIKAHKDEVISLTYKIGTCFKRAYIRLKEIQSAFEEIKSYSREAQNLATVNKNILALGNDFLQHAKDSGRPARHMFAAALTPEGVENKVLSLIDDSYTVYAVKGSPGSGVKDLFRYIEHMLTLSNQYAEIYHCPFDPMDIDMIILPQNKAVMADVSSHIVDYAQYFPSKKYRRFLDFDGFMDSALFASYEKQLKAARERIDTGLGDALSFIKTAKSWHDELETFYVPAMDFDRIEELRKDVTAQLLTVLKPNV